jgi:hypothetical protein
MVLIYPTRMGGSWTYKPYNHRRDMFGINKLRKDVNDLINHVDILRQSCDEAIVNKETILKFLNDLHEITKLAQRMELMKREVDGQEDKSDAKNDKKTAKRGRKPSKSRQEA